MGRKQASTVTVASNSEFSHSRNEIARRAPQITNIDPEALPDEYGMRVLGGCLEPEIPDGARVMIDKRVTAAPGDFVCIYLRPELVKPGDCQARIKRLVMGPPPWVTLPYREHPKSEVQAVLIAEQMNPPRSYTIPCDAVLAVHKVIWPVPANVKFYDAGRPDEGRAA
jgi:hypothetical protein